MIYWIVGGGGLLAGLTEGLIFNHLRKKAFKREMKDFYKKYPDLK